MRIEDVIGGRIASRRDHLGWSQAQVGERLGKITGKPWPRQAVSNAEKGGRVFGAADLVALSIALDCPISTLLEPPAEVDAVSIGGGPPIPSDWFRVATSEIPDVQMVIENMTQLRRALAELSTGASRTQELAERAYRSLQDVLAGQTRPEQS